MHVRGKHVLVVGLARSGLAVTRALVRRGAVVTVVDRKPPVEFREVLPELLKDKVGLELGSQRVETFLRQELIVISPGVPWDLPQLQAAREKMIPVYPEVEAASWFLEGTLVGVTGSNGKTTTTSLLGDILTASGFPTFVGGNIGNALSLAVDQAKPGTKFVIELSSFQLEGIHDFRPHVAVMLNLSPNHLDRHPSLEAYSEAKRQIFRNQGGQDYAVLNADDPWVAGLQSTVPSHPVLFSRQRELPNGVFVSRGKIYYRVRHLERVLFETRDVHLLGDFNLEDVLAATTAACLLGADFAAIRKAVREFKAVEHRLEFVREIQGVDFYNNSKATSVDATLKSLEAFERGVHLIMGGKDKGAPYTPLLPLIKDRVREVLLIGAAAPAITQQLAGSTELVQAGDLSTAVYEAFAQSRPGDTVLLAPACSSFDQFQDYEERGRVFKELVKLLANDVAAGVFTARNKERTGTRDTGHGTTRDTGHGIRDTGQRTDRDSRQARRDSSLAQSVITEPPPLVPEPSYSRTEPPVPRPDPAPSGAESIPAEPLDLPAPMSEPLTPELSVSSSAFQVSSPESQIPDPESSPVPSPESQTSNSESRMANSEPEIPNPEISRVPEPVSRIPSPELSRIPSPEPRVPGSQSSHVPLTYVYEVDAVQMPDLESQVVPEDEPSISISESVVETIEDEVLPFEARPVEEKSGVRSEKKVRGPESEVRGPKSKVRRPKSEVQAGGQGVQPSQNEQKPSEGSDK